MTQNGQKYNQSIAMVKLFAFDETDIFYYSAARIRRRFVYADAEDPDGKKTIKRHKKHF